ncbi:putative membrane protein [Anoxybacillus amylolyticus]|uniref:Putative membrane protein n=1 Tax=Anoxybacteroides amylolyticum TaxID=294699 RepID=A0A167TI69_9BACL|nr:putative membrane protein [Anoxybacillus amylolyticus]
MNPLKQTGSKTIIYSSLCVFVILFIYAISALIIGPNIMNTWFATISRGLVAIMFGAVFLKKTKGEMDKKIRFFRVFIWTCTSFIILCILFVVFLYLVF